MTTKYDDNLDDLIALKAQSFTTPMKTDRTTTAAFVNVEESRLRIEGKRELRWAINNTGADPLEYELMGRFSVKDANGVASEPAWEQVHPAATLPVLAASKVGVATIDCDTALYTEYILRVRDQGVATTFNIAGSGGHGHILTGKDKLLYGTFAEQAILADGVYTLQQFRDGLEPVIYTSRKNLPEKPTRVAETVPAFAIIADGGFFGTMTLAYWHHIDQRGWLLTESPFANPVFGPQFNLDQSFVGNDNFPWKTAVGSEIRITSFGAGGTITNGTCQFGPGAVGRQHAWALIKSTAVQPTPPAVGTYTNVLASGIHTTVAAYTWENLGLPALPAVAEDEWYTLMIWVGFGGENNNLNVLKAGGFINDDLAETVGTLSVNVPGMPPGSVPTPTGRFTANLMGVTSIEITPP